MDLEAEPVPRVDKAAHIADYFELSVEFGVKLLQAHLEPFVQIATPKRSALNKLTLN